MQFVTFAAEWGGGSQRERGRLRVSDGVAERVARRVTKYAPAPRAGGGSGEGRQ